MPKGITRIIIPDKSLQIGQMVKLPTLLSGCEVYGLRANNISVPLTVEMPEEDWLDVEEKLNDRKIRSGVKWVYGAVHSLDKGGIQWYPWFTDSNNNGKRDEGEPKLNNKPLLDISGKDIYNVKSDYNIANTISIQFEEKQDISPSFFWVEAFLNHPELHFSKEPKGIFIIPLNNPNIEVYRTEIEVKNLSFDRNFTMYLPKTEEEALKNENIVYYGEELTFTLHTMLIPPSTAISIEITEKVIDSFSEDGEVPVWVKYKEETLYQGKAILESEDDFSWIKIDDMEIFIYLLQYLKKVRVRIPLTLDKKPKFELIKPFFVNINYKSSAAIGAENPFGETYPKIKGYINILYSHIDTILDKQNEEVDKYVQKQPVIYSQSQSDPCHYTWIKGQKYKYDKDKKIFSKLDGEPVLIFQEKEEGILFPMLTPELDLIAGEDTPSYLKIYSDLKTADCKLQQHTQGRNSVFFFPPDLPAERQGIEIKKMDYDSTEFTIFYKYIRDHKVLSFFDTFPLNYFWCTPSDIQKRLIMVETCRYKIPLRINVYPDIKWTLLINFNFDENDFRDYIKKDNYELNIYRVDYIEVDSSGSARVRSKREFQINKITTRTPKVKKGGFKGVFELLKRFKASLHVEYAGKEGKHIKRDITDETVKSYYRYIIKMYEIFKLISEFANGEVTSEDRNNKKQFEKEIDKINKGRSLQGALKVLSKEPTKTEVLYPSFATSVTWYYKKIEDEQQPEINGRVGLQTDIKIKADPLIGIKFTWDILELIARRHPIAYLIKKIFDLALYLMDPKNGVNITFSVEGKIAFEANFNDNSVGRNVFSWGYSPKRDEPIKLDGSVEAKLEGEIIIKSQVYLIITEINASGKFQIGVKGKIGIKPYVGADKDGLYLATQLYSDGLIFYLKAEAEFKLVFFGFTIIDWDYKSEPKPYTVGKYKADAVKYYFNNPDKDIQYWEVIPEEK